MEKRRRARSAKAGSGDASEQKFLGASLVSFTTTRLGLLTDDSGDDLNLILLLKELWHRKVLLGISILAAIAIPVVVVYQVSLAPPGISKRTQVDAQGSIEILVDSARSPIADARRDLSGLTTRAGVFARLIAGGNVVHQIAKENGIPFDQIDVVGPTPFPGEAPGATSEALQLHPYGISIAQPEELPIVKVATRAPTVEKARALAAAAPKAVRKVVESVQAQQETPADKRVEFRVLGPAKAVMNDEALGKKAALALFFVILAIGIALILGVPRFLTAWKEAKPGDAPPDGDAQAPEILHLAGSDAEVSDAEAAWVGRRREP